MPSDQTVVQHRPVANSMRQTLAVTFLFSLLTFQAFAQNDPVFRTEAASAFVWEEDNHSDGVSSSTRDPVTGNAIHKLNHGGIEVSSQAGFEKITMGEAGEFLCFTTTIINNTESDLSIRQGKASADGHAALPLSVVLTKKGLKNKEGKQTWELVRMHCFLNGFLANEDFFSPDPSSKVFTVAPKKALTVSFVTRDPRHYSVVCAMEGCHPKGTLRFSVTVNTTDFVFVWPGRAMVDCGR
jgi:hypothetical protein